MQQILLFGAGKSATSLIRYLVGVTAARNWRLVVADSDLALASSKIGSAPHARAVATNVADQPAREALIKEADIVISLLPPALHYLVAGSCLVYKKNLLTASYLDPAIRKLEKEIRDSGLLFLCEMGLDPGIDHMSAMELIGQVNEEGGRIHSFRSHTGGLVAPESDDNPWHYKISWNPRNVVLAGSAGAAYKEEGRTITRTYGQLFDRPGIVSVNGIGSLAWYPNRDSLSYIPVYGLEEAETFIRTTLRYPEFCRAWSGIVDAGLTDDQHALRTAPAPNSNDRTPGSTSLTAGITDRTPGRSTLNPGSTAHTPGTQLSSALTFADWSAPLLPYVNDSNRTAFEFLGLFDPSPVPAHARSSADILQYLLETRLAMQPQDKDMIVMLHEISYKTAAASREVTSTLIVKGEDNLQTAMARTVGLPLGIAAKLILEGTIRLTGLHIPILPEIYIPVLRELEEQGIRFEKATLEKVP
ncbi:saccharopine dehydrogenase C-terminal domain-containing protein [Puia sp.]|jgi:saccharopine dehydrogenase (NADP+, L-glutamate forming)|uniref:saccharopine dehydrogenase C-terminal domain-containing protein n=1 Tax=Puia sp. TaxID=2045100 RepID=UPI002F40E6C6